ncbi:hypothetical protein PIB30_100808, partial [Stylosanthes scabra]|nr:hypothetical protein [Stylosanthes scabra]
MKTDLRWRSREEEIGGGWGRNKQIGGDMDEQTATERRRRCSVRKRRCQSADGSLSLSLAVSYEAQLRSSFEDQIDGGWGRITKIGPVRGKPAERRRRCSVRERR